MKHLLILGGGTAGTMAANKLRKALTRSSGSITVVDRDDKHDYQPGYLFIPFGMYTPDEVTKSRRKYLYDDIPLVYGEIDRVDAEATDRAPHRRHACCRTTSSSSRPASRRGPTRRRAWTTRARGTSTSSTSTPTRARRRWRRSSRPGRAAGSSSASSRCPSSARWHRWSSRSSPTSFFTEKRHARQGRDHLRDAAARRVHQADRARSASATCSTTRSIALEPDFMVERVDAEAQDARVLRRARDRRTTCW